MVDISIMQDVCAYIILLSIAFFLVVFIIVRAYDIMQFIYYVKNQAYEEKYKYMCNKDKEQNKKKKRKMGKREDRYYSKKSD